MQKYVKFPQTVNRPLRVAVIFVEKHLSFTYLISNLNRKNRRVGDAAENQILFSGDQ